MTRQPNRMWVGPLAIAVAFAVLGAFAFAYDILTLPWAMIAIWQSGFMSAVTVILMIDSQEVKR